MSDDGYKTEQASGTRFDVPAPESGNAGARPMSFDCCGTRMGDGVAGYRCGSIMKRHPVVTSAILAVMGLAAFAIPVGIILGIIAFFRTI